MGAIVLIYLALALAVAFLAANLWDSKGGSYASGFALGFFLGLLGLIYVAAATPRKTAARAPLSPGDIVENPRHIYGLDFEVPPGQAMTVVSATKEAVTVRLADAAERVIPRTMLTLSEPEPIALKTCPRCAEDVRAAARICRFCGYEFASD